MTPATPGFRRHLAVQDGMEPSEARLSGSCAPRVWLALARHAGRFCHVGRVGTYPRVRWALRSHFDSFDSNLPLWSEGNLRNFLDAIRHEGEQPELDYQRDLLRGFGVR